MEGLNELKSFSLIHEEEHHITPLFSVYILLSQQRDSSGLKFLGLLMLRAANFAVGSVFHPREAAGQAFLSNRRCDRRQRRPSSLKAATEA